MDTARERPGERRRAAAIAGGHGHNLMAASIAHALHDGYTDALYAFLPLWQVQFGLSYAGLGIVRSLYYATMGGLQLPADRVLRRASPLIALLLATMIAAAGFAIMALPLGFVGLCVGLVVAGVGSSIQHPRGSLLVSETYGVAARRPLGVYNFAGDLGKATLPAFAALLLPLLAWRPVIGLLSLLGVVVSGIIVGLAPSLGTRGRDQRPSMQHGQARRGFALLTLIGGLDTATRMGYLLFLPFLIHARGGGSSTVGFALAILFIGGAFGKAVCTRISERLGVVRGVAATEAATASLIVLTIFMPLAIMLVTLPLLGVVLNGTSSILYGTVPEVAPDRNTGRAFAVFYTSVIGSGAIAPIIYGAIADRSSQATGIVAAALTAAAIVPLAMALRQPLRMSSALTSEDTA